MGLPGAGKTTLADELAPLLNAKRLNAFNLLAFNNGASSSAKVVLPAPGSPIINIIFIFMY